MVEQRRYSGSRESIDRFDDRAIRSREQRGYAFGRSAPRRREEDPPPPLFLSEVDELDEVEDYDEEEDYEQEDEGHGNPLHRFRGSNFSFRILMLVLGASAFAMLFALFSSDTTRDLLESAKASIAGALPVPTASAQPEMSSGLTARDLQLKDPTRMSAASATANLPKVAMAPTREDISSAYQSALQTRTMPAPPPAAVSTPELNTPQFVTTPQPVVAPPAAAVPQQVPVAPMAAIPQPGVPAAAGSARRIEPEEVAALMKRAREMLAAGDIPSARLLLKRAAGAPDVTAALLLAQSYDADILGARDVRNITPDMATARAWYERAAALGSADAQRRLAQMQN